VSVALQGVAGLGATLAVSYRATWLFYAATVLFLAGLAAYAVIVWRFDFGSVSVGAGDQWVAGGALAIAALTGAKIAAAFSALDAAGDLGGLGLGGGRHGGVGHGGVGHGGLGGAWLGGLDDLALAL